MRWLIAFLLSCSVAIAGQGMGPGPGVKPYSSGGVSSISDDFSTDTSSNYTAVNGSGFAISGGYATAGSNDYNYAAYVNNTALSSSNNYIDATIEIAATSTGTVNPIVRCNGTTGYMARIYFDGSQVQLESFNGGTSTYIGTFASTSYASGFHRFRLEANGTTFTLKHWNGTSFDTIGTITDSTYSTGTKVGAWFRNNGAFAKWDSFTAGTL